MNLYNLGPVDWIESQSLYHALAVLGREGLIICYPTTPYVCLGIHDDLDHEIDQVFCHKNEIPLLRRETGGGVVYLDNRQVFFQLVIRQDNPLLPLSRQKLYDKFLQPAVSVYRSLGMPVEIKAPADLTARGQKCSGNASGDIEECVAYVGNLLLDFDFVTMSRVLRVPNEMFRRYLYLAMQANMTTLGQWCKHPVGYADLALGLITGFTQQFGQLSAGTVDAELRETAAHIGKKLTSPDWLQIPGRRPTIRKVKIAEGVYLVEKQLGPKKSVTVLVKDGIEQEIIA